jgi:predicted metal-dependent phosphoesterase TrpH
VKLDTHVHTQFSGYSTIPAVSRLMRESYNTPDGVYQRAKARGMDLVAITDHDVIEGALTIADRPDVIVGCEVTGVFAGDGVRVHLLVLGITEAQHRDIQHLRHDVCELLPYLKQARIFVSLNHVASRVNGRITGAHVAALIPWIDGLEVRNGSRSLLRDVARYPMLRIPEVA